MTLKVHPNDDVTRDELQREIGDAHTTIQSCAFDLQDISRKVDYFHPKLAKELHSIAMDLEEARKIIQGNEAMKINMEIQRSTTLAGRSFTRWLAALHRGSRK